MMTLHLVRIFLLTLPFQFALNPFPGVDLHVSRVFALVIFFSWLASGLLRKKLSIPFSWAAFFLFSFVFFSCVSFLWAEHAQIALRRAAFLLSFTPLFPVFSWIIAEKKEQIDGFLLKPLFLGAAISGIIGITQTTLPFFLGVGPAFHFWISEILPFFLGSSFAASVAEYPSLLVNIGGSTVLRASALFPDPHMAAYYMGIVFPVGAYLSFRSETLTRRVMFSALSAAVLFADLLSFSRGAYLGLVFGMIGFAAMSFHGLNPQKKFFFAVFSAVLIVISIFPWNPIGSRLLSSFSFAEGSNQGRIMMWREALERISEQPISGYGLGNYPFAVKPDAAFREPIYAHNLLLDIATETGIFGAILFFLALFSAFVGLVRARSALAVSLLVFFGHSIVESPLYSVHILPLILLLFAFGASDDRV